MSELEQQPDRTSELDEFEQTLARRLRRIASTLAPRQVKQRVLKLIRQEAESRPR